MVNSTAVDFDYADFKVIIIVAEGYFNYTLHTPSVALLHPGRSYDLNISYSHLGVLGHEHILQSAFTLNKACELVAAALLSDADSEVVPMCS
ncbi:hypothetical protein D3C84_1139880 [compost metagenome]